MHPFRALASWYRARKLLITASICAVVFLSPIAFALAGPYALYALSQVSTILIFAIGITASGERRGSGGKPMHPAAFNIWLLLGVGHFLLAIGIQFGYFMREYNGYGLIATMLAFGCAFSMPEQFEKLFPKKVAGAAAQREEP